MCYGRGRLHTPIPGLSGHAVFLLLVQLALLVAVARIGAEIAKRFGLPAVVGELTAGIALGPIAARALLSARVRGHLPARPAAVPPAGRVRHRRHELLLLLTGLETDLRLLRNLGRAALIASVMGMVLPFGLGFGLGYFMPAEYLADPNSRMLFSLFLATAMSISAMPVIAKILDRPGSDQAQHRPGHPVGRRRRRHRGLADPVADRRRPRPTAWCASRIWA